MKQLFKSIIILLFFYHIVFAQSSTFDYFGLTPHSNTLEVFAPEIISIDGVNNKDITVSPDGNEVFFSRIKGGWPYGKIMHMVKSNGVWSSPDTADFSKDIWAIQPSLSPDGQYLYFSSSKGQSNIRNYSLWRTKKDGGVWGEPESIINMGTNREVYQQYDPIVTNEGVYFLHWNYDTQTGDLYKANVTNGVISTPVLLESPINVANDQGPYVDPDETFMVFHSNRSGGFGDHDSYISYKKNGNWTNPKNLGSKFNTSGYDNYMDVSPDSKYMYIYTNNKTYWVQLGNLIDSLKNTNCVPYNKSKISNQTDTLGVLYNFQIPDDIFYDDDGNNTLTYSASLNNGNSLPTWLTFNSETKTFSGIPDIAGTITIMITVKDTANAKATTTFRLTTQSLTSISQESSQLPQNFMLYQNYPNPFNPSTIISYQLLTSGSVRLKIYDSLGREVKTLIDSFQSAGEYSLIWDGQDNNNNQVCSGVYFYSLATNKISQKKKMILAR